MFIGGLDVGTSGCKIAVYDEKCVLIKTYYNEYESHHKDGFHEISFSDIKNSVIELIALVVRDCKLSVLGVTSFGETFAMLDGDDRVLGKSMLYTDPRGKEQCEQLCAAIGAEELTRVTGVSPNQMYSIYKIMWQRDNNPKQYSNCRHILLGQDYIVYTLTGNAQIDYSLAARTAAFDIRKKIWCEKIFGLAGIDVRLLSKPVPTGTVAGLLKPKLKKQLGIDYDITVVTGCHDQVAAMIGAAVLNCGQAMDGTGTVECMPVVLNDAPEDIRLYEGGYSVVPFVDKKYACYAFSFTGGAALKWFRNRFVEIDKAESAHNETNIYAQLDSTVPQQPTKILIMPHFAGAATPYMDSQSKAAIVGLTLETTRSDIYKALMEGTSYEILLNFNTLKAFTGEVTDIRATGGGAFSDVWLQIKADILGTEIAALSCKEVGAAGTAALAGIAVGCYVDLKSTALSMASVRKKFIPKHENRQQYAELFRKYRNLYSAVKSLDKK